MPWNNGGPNDGSGGRGPSPWGEPGGDGNRKTGRNSGRPGGGPNGPWGGGPGGTPPDLEDIIARVQSALRGLLPGGPRRRGGGGGGGWVGAMGGGRGLALIVVALVAVWLASGFYRVQPDEQGVVLRFGAYDRTTLPGLNYHIPWPVETVELPAVTRINRVEIGYRSASDIRGQPGRSIAIHDVPEESLMLTGDENIIDIDCAVFWRIRDASAFLFNTRNPDYTVKSAAESVLREVIGRTPIQPALTDARARIEADVTKGLQAILDQYGTGVEVTQVQLQKVDPPSAVIESFRDVQRANTDAERMRNEAEAYHNDIVPRARGDAARLVAEADGARQASVAEATGQGQRFLSVLHAYQAAKNVTLERLYIETMESILRSTPTTVIDDQLRGVIPYLPLGSAAGAGTGGVPPPPAGASDVTPPAAPPPPPPAAQQQSMRTQP